VRPPERTRRSGRGPIRRRSGREWRAAGGAWRPAADAATFEVLGNRPRPRQRWGHSGTGRGPRDGRGAWKPAADRVALEARRTPPRRACRRCVGGSAGRESLHRRNVDRRKGSTHGRDAAAAIGRSVATPAGRLSPGRGVGASRQPAGAALRERGRAGDRRRAQVPASLRGGLRRGPRSVPRRVPPAGRAGPPELGPPTPFRTASARRLVS